MSSRRLARLAGHVAAAGAPHPASHATIEGADDDEDLVMIPMRDGTRLAMRLVTPDEGEGPWPALFQQRYGNDGSDPGGMDDMKELASHGFAVGLVLFRGAWQSEGEWNGYRHLGWGEHYDDGVFADGYDTCEWLAAQPWCTGSAPRPTTPLHSPPSPHPAPNRPRHHCRRNCDHHHPAISLFTSSPPAGPLEISVRCG